MNRIITVSREFGSGGRELARRLAEKLGVAYYDQEIITEIAKRTDLSVGYVKQITANRPFASFPLHIGEHLGQSLYVDPVLQQSSSVYGEQHKIIQEIADKSDCLIVGRCADYILRDRHPFRIFVYASIENKVARCMAHRTAGESDNVQEMKKKICSLDRNRAKYYEFYCDQKWGARENYDLMVNTRGEVVEKTADAVYDYLMKILK